MLRKISYAVGVLILLAGAGLLYARSQGTRLPGLGARPVAEAIEQPIATHDSTAVANFMLARCRLMLGKQHQACYDEILLALVARDQVRLAMDALAVLERLDPALASHGHDYTHVVGINAYSEGKDVGKVYDSCTGFYQSGCYHGVVQAYLDAHGTDSSTVSTLCNKIPSTVVNVWLRFQCVHGLGHGLVQNFSHHLPKALAGCDWLVDSWDAESCYGGAFMEFILAARGQEHHPHKKAAPVSAAGHDGMEHAGHEMPADSFAYRKASDPLYPCTAIEPKYQASCYGMQAGIIIEHTGADFGKIAAACDQAPLGLRPACYQGIGTYASGFVVRNPDKAIDICQRGSDRFKAWCFVGVVKNFIDVTATADDGLVFCGKLIGQRPLAVACYVAIGEEMGVLYRDPADREKQCARAPADYVPACRYGAILHRDRPPELTPFRPTA